MSQVAKFELMPETRATWVGVNSQEYVVINKSFGCWTLYIEPQTSKGKHHHSSHNTYDEAVKMAETVTPWTTNFGLEIVRCENGVGEWEIHPTGETFDTRREAEARLKEMMDVDKLDFLQKLNELYDIAHEQSYQLGTSRNRDIEWFQIACSIQETAKYIKGLIEVERKNDK